MRNLCFLLIPMGIALLIFSIRKTIRFAKAELFFEMPCTEEEGNVYLPQGNYGLWLSGRRFKKTPIGNLLFKQPVDLSNFTVQIRKGNSMAVLFVILGINLAVWMILGGIMLPFLLAEAGY